MIRSPSERPPTPLGTTSLPRAAEGIAPTIDDVWRDSEAAVRRLAQRNVQFVLVARLWVFRGNPFRFDYLPVYEQVATDAGLKLRQCTRRWSFGDQHLLFFVKDRHVTDEDLMRAAS